MDADRCRAGPDAAAQELGARGWDGRLALGFVRRGEETVLMHRAHAGPLTVQKALHPEGPGVCQAIVVHPPGGIAEGDRLSLTVDVGVRAHAQLTTPGAAKWYRCRAATARQTIDARVAAGAILEWLPQEAIVFDGARVETATTVALAGDAAFVGWDIVGLGRTASGERFDHGSVSQRFKLVRDGALVWTERAMLEAHDALAASPAGLNGRPMFGTFVVAMPAIADEVFARCRGADAAGLGASEAAVTRLPGVLLARCRGEAPAAARRWFAALWEAVRPALCGRAVVPPRIWNT